MKTTARIVPLLAMAATASIAWIAAARTPEGPSAPQAEHKLLERYAGKWDAEVRVQGPDATTDKTPAKSVARVTCGGLWLVSDFEGSMMGGPFVGHELLGYDPDSKRYVVTWIDSTSAAPFTGEFTWNEKTSTLEGTMKGKTPSGKEMTWRQTDTWTSADTREWAMHLKGPDGNETTPVQIAYKRSR